jgi:ABC-type dipeptide/oligopeptide/nickel transport system permease subunit
MVLTNQSTLGGDPVGPHLGLLGQFFIGYRVSFLGSIIGFAYGFALGTLSGSLIGWIYNKIVVFRNRGDNL